MNKGLPHPLAPIVEMYATVWPGFVQALEKDVSKVVLLLCKTR